MHLGEKLSELGLVHAPMLACDGMTSHLTLADLVKLCFSDGGITTAARKLKWSYRKAQRVFHAEQRILPREDLEQLAKLIDRDVEELCGLWRRERVAWTRKELQRARKAVAS